FAFHYFSRMVFSISTKRIFLQGLIYVLCSMLYTPVLHAQWTQNTSPTYPELISYYKKLDAQHKEIELYAMGESDYGLPIYVCIVNGAQDSLKTFAKARTSTTLLVNNAIHAGEPDGVNACLIWLDNWIKNGKKTDGLPVIAFIPAYNVGGMMNRSTNSRANQNGPEEYGFRGNAQNLDLNRDFIKMDSKNAFTFATIYHALDPDVFVDTHVSNGADYQYTLTYISSMKERLAPSLRSLTYEKVIPSLTTTLKKKKWDLFPYVELLKETPEEGMHAFNDLPRYAMGYASLFDAVSFTVETHMLKPFPQRVQATHDFIADLIVYTGTHSTEIELARKEARTYWQQDKQFEFAYQLTDKKDSIRFKGFEFTNPPSPVTGLPRLKYHEDRPYEKFIPYFQTYQAKDSVVIPSYFIVGSQCDEVIERLVANKVQFTRFDKDTVIQISQERLSEFKSYGKPYEGHFYHNEVKSNVELVDQYFKKGDVLIPTNQYQRNFLLSILISRAEDSYFRWNFFDSYLQQKEYFSPYVFEEKAVEILKEKPWIKEELELMKAADKSFRESQWDQLYFIYKNSDLFEESYYLLPISLKSVK
ncbi:MAG: hypothetical protein RLZ33_1704, partial [Bacteroidota bacterium]